MLIERSPNEFVAQCEDCDETSAPLPESREVAVLRLMRARWRVKTDGGITKTWCPACQSALSVPVMKIAR